MAHHQVERRKELKQRRKRRKERLKERRKAASAQLKTAQKISRVISKESDPGPSPITKPAVTTTRHASGDDFQNAQSIEGLVKLLPADIKAKKIWPVIPAQVKEEIIGKARRLAEARDFAAPAEWDGSLKQALLLIASGRLPNGFKIFLGLP